MGDVECLVNRLFNGGVRIGKEDSLICYLPQQPHCTISHLEVIECIVACDYHGMLSVFMIAHIERVQSIVTLTPQRLSGPAEIGDVGRGKIYKELRSNPVASITIIILLKT